MSFSRFGRKDLGAFAYVTAIFHQYELSDTREAGWLAYEEFWSPKASAKVRACKAFVRFFLNTSPAKSSTFRPGEFRHGVLF
ncbi:hypothetical protein MPNT_30065 [Candidatus Methylacidithermus pantelleriae]|uniref:Uncharacterized protein n=1 Tax=Candidatus Methylacidithermus pantelleriae TaxID=2744239 RepID=A0A8J2BK31_9BACT|nr:hypothetical protein MPNT_30065 [Candidatus Methylacidithermus pantelleriae]